MFEIYGTGEEPEFDYIEGSPKGPQHWGELKPEWAECKDGRSQSPIDILNKNVKIASKTGDLRLNYKASNATVKNTGFSIEVAWEGDAGSIHIDGKDYPLQQCHWHLPSEHLINGKRYELELHMAHIDASNKISVAHAQFYQIGEPDSFLSKFTEEIKSLVKKKEERPKGVIDPRDSNMEAVKYYKYNGSQTFPPCAEGITWIINEKVNTVSNEQVQLLREANFDNLVTAAAITTTTPLLNGFAESRSEIQPPLQVGNSCVSGHRKQLYRSYAKNNARPVQALNGREIFRYC
ncbi:alpha carbonic anhydrase 7 [Quercus suber]|uniref:Carbonic anhydrase n=1 Tax=Quercus suber TaxID=58331 RepID=A0AAW0KKH1_QUESU